MSGDQICTARTPQTLVAGAGRLLVHMMMLFQALTQLVRHHSRGRGLKRVIQVSSLSLHSKAAHLLTSNLQPYNLVPAAFHTLRGLHICNQHNSTNSDLFYPSPAAGRDTARPTARTGLRISAHVMLMADWEACWRHWPVRRALQGAAAVPRSCGPAGWATGVPQHKDS